LIKGGLRNRIVKSGEKELSLPFILISRIKFTHGNKQQLEDFCQRFE
jgi:hypothetical protein